MVTIDLPAAIHGEYLPARFVGTPQVEAEAVDIKFGDHNIAHVVPRFPPGLDRLTDEDISGGYSYTNAEEKEIAEYTVAKVLALALREFNTHD